MAGKEKVRVNEMGPEDIEDPEERDILNRLARGINRINERIELFEAGKITAAEVSKLQREDDKELREINRKIGEYKKRSKA